MSTQAAVPAPQPGWWSRNWKWFVPTGCLTLILLFRLFIAGIFALVMDSMKSSDAYKQAVAKARANPAVVEKLGTPIVEGYFVTGSFNVHNDTGDADFEIPISGPQGQSLDPRGGPQVGREVGVHAADGRRRRPAGARPARSRARPGAVSQAGVDAGDSPALPFGV